MVRYKNASYGGESVTLKNQYLCLEVHKRLSGWGWGELLNAEGEFIAVLDHLGEIMLRDQDIPMRMEATSVEQDETPEGTRLTFHVKSLLITEMLKGTSFDGWIHYPIDEHIMKGTVTLTLMRDQPILRISQRLVSTGNAFARYVRGPWLRVGQDAFGVDKDDAIFPGIEWLVGDEWSSGTDWFKDPWAMRCVPHPYKVAIPVMAVSHGGTAIGLAWDPNQFATGWFNYRRQFPQPVFSSPNAIDRRNHHLMGLMVPDVDVEPHENQVYAEPPLELHPDQRVEFDAEIFLCQGTSLDSVTNWVQRHGMPRPPEPRWPLEEALHHIAEAYTKHLWHEGQGFGIPQHENPYHPSPPRFADRYLEAYPDAPSAAALRREVEWCRAQPGYRPNRRSLPIGGNRDSLLERARKLLGYQRDDGSFVFDPDGQHYTKDDFVTARAFLEPMGLAGDTALDITILPAMELLAVAEALGATDPETAAIQEGARKALDFCLPMHRPEGGDFWETPLHSPNLLAAGHAANAYLLGFRAFGDDRYRQKAVHWIRALLPFTHLWQPRTITMMYNTKPCLCSSDWYFANWVRDHVQWEVLETFALSVQLGIDWAEVDPELDWHTYQEGITTAALRWMLDHRVDNWLPHNLPATYPQFLAGAFDDCFADTHNTTTGNYGGMAIPPDVIAVNLMAVLAYQNEPGGKG